MFLESTIDMRVDKILTLIESYVECRRIRHSTLDMNLYFFSCLFHINFFESDYVSRVNFLLNVRISGMTTTKITITTKNGCIFLRWRREKMNEYYTNHKNKQQKAFERYMRLGFVSFVVVWGYCCYTNPGSITNDTYYRYYQYPFIIIQQWLPFYQQQQ